MGKRNRPGPRPASPAASAGELAPKVAAPVGLNVSTEASAAAGDVEVDDDLLEDQGDPSQGAAPPDDLAAPSAPAERVQEAAPQPAPPPGAAELVDAPTGPATGAEGPGGPALPQRAPCTAGHPPAEAGDLCQGEQLGDIECPPGALELPELSPLDVGHPVYEEVRTPKGVHLAAPASAEQLGGVDLPELLDGSPAPSDAPAGPEARPAAPEPAAELEEPREGLPAAILWTTEELLHGVPPLPSAPAPEIWPVTRRGLLVPLQRVELFSAPPMRAAPPSLPPVQANHVRRRLLGNVSAWGYTLAAHRREHWVAGDIGDFRQHVIDSAPHVFGEL
jgi:hypothetical protein